ncbi:MAG: CpsD/CapB family tyrosine-protein kinase [Ruminococcaceae bacterium]|nr:CpsD/CapB family tyrosine-protein kinase [Oscillospiraceae bacterium]
MLAVNENKNPVKDVQSKVPFSVVEAYKGIRVNLIHELAKTNSKIVLITSANAGEGKSTTAINTAITLSKMNKKVLLLDIDARRATVHKKLKLDNELGCIELLAGELKLEEVVKSYNPYLDVITAGGMASNVSELFVSYKFDELMDSLKESYDYVIIDSPPVNLVSDTLAVSQKCDGVVIVCYAGVTTAGNFRKAVSAFENLGVKVIGAILNGVSAKSKKYYNKYGYNKYSY